MARETKRSGNERFKYGICLNEECPKCKAKEVQQIPMRKEFVCECGSELRECPPPKKGNNKLLLIIIAAIVVVGGIVAAILALGGKSEPVLLTLNKQQVELRVGECDTIVANITPSDIGLTPQFKSSNEDVAIINSDGIIRALAKGEAIVTVTVNSENDPEVVQKITVQVNEAEPTLDNDSIRALDSMMHAQLVADSIAAVKHHDSIEKVKTANRKQGGATATKSSGTLTLSYGKYSGSVKNGYPHGQGRLTYSSNRVINKNDTKKRTASPGDYVIGEFFNGFVVYGKHYNAAGELLESLNIGVGSEDNYDSK